MINVPARRLHASQTHQFEPSTAQVVAARRLQEVPRLSVPGQDTASSISGTSSAGTSDSGGGEGKRSRRPHHLLAELSYYFGSLLDDVEIQGLLLDQPGKGHQIGVGHELFAADAFLVDVPAKDSARSTNKWHLCLLRQDDKIIKMKARLGHSNTYSILGSLQEKGTGGAK